MLLTGRPLRSAYRVISRDGRVIWFHCEAKIVRGENGQPWFIHGVGFDITDLKRAETALQSEGDLLSGILDTVGALVVVLSPSGEIVRFNRACELLSGYRFEEVRGRRFWELFSTQEESERCRTHLAALQPGQGGEGYEGDWVAGDGSRRRIAWTATSLPGEGPEASYIITTGIDITERKRMERALLEISAREQRQIGQDLHDGLGQHLTGIAFMSKVLAQQLAGDGTSQAEHARKIVRLVNEAIDKTRQLARGLLPVFSEADGLMSALKQWAGEVEDLFHVSCRLECAEPIQIRDVGVATHLYHIAQEAVNNALRHGRAHSIVLSLGRENGSGILRVEDDGIGLRDRPARHPGLGLRIMSYRANMVGGTLEVRSGVPNGHSGQLPVSVAELRQEDRRMSQAAAFARAPVGRRHRVFVVDDHPIVRQGLALLIDQEPDLVVCGAAEEAESALAGIAASRPDILVLDISLPGPDGIDLLKTIRSIDPTPPDPGAFHARRVDVRRAGAPGRG